MRGAHSVTLCCRRQLLLNVCGNAKGNKRMCEVGSEPAGARPKGRSCGRCTCADQKRGKAGPGPGPDRPGPGPGPHKDIRVNSDAARPSPEAPPGQPFPSAASSRSRVWGLARRGSGPDRHTAPAPATTVPALRRPCLGLGCPARASRPRAVRVRRPERRCPPPCPRPPARPARGDFFSAGCAAAWIRDRPVVIRDVCQ